MSPGSKARKSQIKCEATRGLNIAQKRERHEQNTSRGPKNLTWQLTIHKEEQIKNNNHIRCHLSIDRAKNDRIRRIQNLLRVYRVMRPTETPEASGPLMQNKACACQTAIFPRQKLQRQRSWMQFSDENTFSYALRCYSRKRERDRNKRTNVDPSPVWPRSPPPHPCPLATRILPHLVHSSFFFFRVMK